METEKKVAWIDEENKILAFHEIENSIRIEKSEEEFWIWALKVVSFGYRIM